MNKDIIMLGVQLVIAVVCFVLGKYVFPNIPESIGSKLFMLEKWAENFVVWAKEFMQLQTGEEKMKAVVKKLNEIAEKEGLDVTEEQLKAIVQKAYESMKAGQNESNMQLTEMLAAEGIKTRPQNISIIVNAGKGDIVPTDDVPEGALTPNEDGSVNVYDETGKKTGTLSKEAAEAATTYKDYTED